MPLNLTHSFSKKPLVSYFTRERASLNLPVATNITTTNPDTSTSLGSMPRRKKGSRATRSRSASRSRKRNIRTSNKVRVIGGRVRLRVTGYQGLQSLAPSSLIRFIPTTKLRLAARRVLLSSGQRPVRRRKRSSKKKKNTRKRRR